MFFFPDDSIFSGRKENDMSSDASPSPPITLNFHWHRYVTDRGADGWSWWLWFSLLLLSLLLLMWSFSYRRYGATCELQPVPERLTRRPLDTLKEVK